ncbi:hypothetical protein OH76DRAFT_152735 [Lentinus brumalis]|uniref:Uncharacterized protein n=1 Tax=Lentinus brumalis TaxID=2498619 RepID=A0A371CNR5_9APHY|nr:hypothetical protein OH76DRAFT_152735 [Polyporus brumalis]
MHLRCNRAHWHAHSGANSNANADGTYVPQTLPRRVRIRRRRRRREASDLQRLQEGQRRTVVYPGPAPSPPPYGHSRAHRHPHRSEIATPLRVHTLTVMIQHHLNDADVYEPCCMIPSGCPAAAPSRQLGASADSEPAAYGALPGPLGFSPNRIRIRKFASRKFAGRKALTSANRLSAQVLPSRSLRTSDTRVHPETVCCFVPTPAMPTFPRHPTRTQTDWPPRSSRSARPSFVRRRLWSMCHVVLPHRCAVLGL